MKKVFFVMAAALLLIVSVSADEQGE